VTTSAIRAAIGGLRCQPGRVLVLWLVVLGCVSTGELLPGNSRTIVLLSTANISDKVLHMTAYALLALLPAVAFRAGTALLFVMITELIGVALEVAQGVVPGRSCEPTDVVANTVGLLVGAALGRTMGSWARRNTDNDFGNTNKRHISPCVASATNLWCNSTGHVRRRCTKEPGA
jgi:hypothetical protein